MQLKSSESILICCAGLGMGNASRAAAIMESLHGLRLHFASWGAGYKFLIEYRKNTGADFEITKLDDYSASGPRDIPALAAAFIKNCVSLRRLVRKLQPSLILLDSDYHFPAYAFCGRPRVFVGQAADVSARAVRFKDALTTRRERFNLLLRERLDAFVQRITCDVVLVPCFEPGPAGAGKVKRIPLIVRKEFLQKDCAPAQDAANGFLLSGSELEKKPFVAFAKAQGWPLLSPGSGSVPSRAARLDEFSTVFTQGGLSSISECIARRRFVAVFPMRGHPEQVLNAYEVERLGLGIAASAEELSEWPLLKARLESACKTRPACFPACNGAEVAARILTGLLKKTPQRLPLAGKIAQQVKGFGLFF